MKYQFKDSVKKIFKIFGVEIRRAHAFNSYTFDHTFLRLAALGDLGFNPVTVCDIGASNGIWYMDTKLHRDISRSTILLR
jgi:hypothetical protein